MKNTKIFVDTFAALKCLFSWSSLIVCWLSFETTIWEEYLNDWYILSPQRSFTYNNDPDKEKEVGGEQREDGDLHHDVKLAVDEEGAARTGQVRGEVLQKLNHDQQQRVSYRGAW